MAFYHKFKPEDMPEIRRLRSMRLRHSKLKEKTKRVDKYSKAILPDINWSKLSLDRNMVDEDTLDYMDILDSKIDSFRKDIADSLQGIFGEETTQLWDQIFNTDTPSEIKLAAEHMAEKYHSRSTKSRNRKSKCKNQTASKSPPKAVTKTPPKSPAKSPSTDKQSNEIDTTKSDTDDSPQETTPWSRVTAKGKRHWKSSTRTPQTTECQHGTPQITTFFKNIKTSSRYEIPSRPSKFDFSTHNGRPLNFNFMD